MKHLIDAEVTDRSYYYLLEWNEYNKRIAINGMFNKNRLCDLTKDEYFLLMKFAFETDVENFEEDCK